MAGSAVSTLQRLLGLPTHQVSGKFDKRTLQSIQAPIILAGGTENLCDSKLWEFLFDLEDQEHPAKSQGEKVSRTRQRKRLQKITLHSGVEDFERLTLHDLRHTAASLAVSAGATAKSVQNMLGHESAKMTLDTYAGLFETDRDALAQAMDAAHEEALAARAG